MAGESGGKEKVSTDANAPTDVGCAIIERKGSILIAQRKPGAWYSGYWEFPGGKRESGETIPACLIREVSEELGIEIFPEKLIWQSEYVYPHRRARLYFYICRWVSGTPFRRDCHDHRWVLLEEMSRYRFLPADLPLIREMSLKKKHYFGPGWPG